MSGYVIPANTPGWFREENFSGLEVWHLDHIPWYEADLPKKHHKCIPQTIGWINYITRVERCACGNTKYDGIWLTYKNSRTVKFITNHLTEDPFTMTAHHMRHHKDKVHWIEFAIAMVALILMAGVLGFLITRPDATPYITSSQPVAQSNCADVPVYWTVQGVKYVVSYQPWHPPLVCVHNG